MRGKLASAIIKDTVTVQHIWWRPALVGRAGRESLLETPQVSGCATRQPKRADALCRQSIVDSCLLSAHGFLGNFSRQYWMESGTGIHEAATQILRQVKRIYLSYAMYHFSFQSLQAIASKHRLPNLVGLRSRLCISWPRLLLMSVHIPSEEVRQ